ncbi:multiubiquitin domain-containing protein [Pedobacter gandavensis]|uniref:multiubiquitin domain-containing protein n=1 Tax=Pedobacter gandavensis TaxID=2679963 RepID=UPI002930651B|nr:multiubiquitin domain-containing protein [Pedobacter gandavensis]
MNNFNNTSNEDRTLELTIDGKQYAWNAQYITGAQIRELAGADTSSLESKLFLSIKRPWQDELIEDNTSVNLARPEVEHFYIKNILLLTINNVEYSWDREFITGLEIKLLAGINEEDELYLSIKKPWEDELIANDGRVNLARPGIEHFYSKQVEKQSEIIVNGRERQWSEKNISFPQVVSLAFDTYVENETTIYTVTYKRGPKANPEGTMVKGDIVHVKNKMVFNVTATDKS